MTRQLAGSLLGVVVSITMAACGDDDAETTTTTVPPSTTAAPTVLANSTAAASTATTNIPVVDAAIKAALGGDAAALTAMTRLQSLACKAVPSGPIPAQPKCLSNQPEGAMVQAILVSSGSGGWLQGSELPVMWSNWFSTSRELFAVKKLTSADALTGAIYHVVFTRPDKMGISLRMSADGIVGIGFDPSFNPRQQADGPAGTFIIAPK